MPTHSERATAVRIRLLAMGLSIVRIPQCAALPTVLLHRLASGEMAVNAVAKINVHCGFCALAAAGPLRPKLARRSGEARKIQERIMKSFALAVALVVAGLSLGGCFVGKGKAPAPVITKG